MSGRPWYSFYPDAYERDAGHLSYVQDSAYRRMLDIYYKTCAPLPLDHDIIYRACRALRREERAGIDYCLGAFFNREADGYHNTRADEEIAKAEAISAKRADAANKRHSKHSANDDAKSDATHHAIAQQLDTHLHSTSTATPSEAKASSGTVVRRASKAAVEEPPGFAEFYEAFPLHKARPAAAKAYARAVSRASPRVLLDGAQRYAKSRVGEDPKYTKHPATWLNHDCWLDEEVSRETVGRSESGHRGERPASFGASVARAVDRRAGGGGGLFGDGGAAAVEASDEPDTGGVVIEGSFARAAPDAA